MLEPSTPVQFVKGIGPRLAEVLAAKGIATVDDLLHYLPFRYEDRLNPRSVAELRAGEMATVIAEVRNSGLFRTRRMPIFQLTVGQGRTRLKCIWFNAAYLQDRFQAGQMLALYGKVEEDRDGELQIVQPQFEILGDINEEGGADESREKSRRFARDRTHRSHLRIDWPGQTYAALVPAHYSLDARKSESRSARSNSRLRCGRI